MRYSDYKVKYPEKGCRRDQDEEWITLVSEGRTEKIRLHDYEKLYSVPGLYEEVVYDKLQCNSPQVVCSMLKEEIEKTKEQAARLRVLDFGAGNGIVGECLDKEIGCDAIVGVDIVEEALEATSRDRPGLYDDYYVMDLSKLNDHKEKQLAKWDFNALVTVAALGYNHIPTHAFLNVYNLLDDGAWVAFNIKDRFLSEEDSSGYREILLAMMGDSLTILQERCYCHRLSLSGEQLDYCAIVGRKSKDATVW
jgi:SAM-dependent methyltransferase